MQKTSEYQYSRFQFCRTSLSLSQSSTFQSLPIHTPESSNLHFPLPISPRYSSPLSLIPNFPSLRFFSYRFNADSVSRLQQLAMVKNTQKRRAEPKPALPSKYISKQCMRQLLSRKLSRNCSQSKVRGVLHHQIVELLSESMLECPICLQLFLQPVLAECGHIFCLTCAEDLAKNDYPCGICHDNQPTYDLTVYRAFQELVHAYIRQRPEEESSAYEKRCSQLQEKESKREVGKLSKGDFLDFWCTEERCWKAAVAEDISSQGTVLLSQLKRSKCLQINILSRRLARYRYYTKEEPSTFSIINRFDSPVNNYHRTTVSPTGMFGVPMFINMFGSQDRSQGFSGFDGSDYFGFMPQYRPFSF